PDRVEQPEARLAIGRLLHLEQALVHERHQSIEDVTTYLGRGPADRLDRGKVASGPEDRQAIDQPASARLEELIAPGDRSAQRLLALRQVTRPGGQDVELMIETRQDRIRRQDLDARRGEL